MLQLIGVLSNVMLLLPMEIIAAWGMWSRTWVGNATSTTLLDASAVEEPQRHSPLHRGTSAASYCNTFTTAHIGISSAPFTAGIVKTGGEGASLPARIGTSGDGGITAGLWL